MATYSGTIDLRVTGNALKETNLINKRINELRALTSSLKPVPNLFDKNQKDPKIVKAKKDLRRLIEEYRKGVGAGKRFSNTLSGLNAQISAFGKVIGNVNIGSDEFVDAITAQEKASRRLARAEAARLKVQTQINTANTVGRSTSVQETLDLSKVIPKSISGLELYQRELQDTFRNVRVGSKDYQDLSRAIADVNRQLAVARGEGPVQGPALPKGFSEKGRISQGRSNRFQDSLATGVGFPLLFGGGPGSVAGGALGAILGKGEGGFGLQILFSAVGAQLDQAFKTLQDIGNAVQAIDVERLVEANIRINSELRTQLSQLKKLGDVDSARELVSNRVAEVTGTIPGTVEDISNAVNLLGAAWNGVVQKASTFVGIIGAPLAVALAGALKGLDLILTVFNLLLSAVGNAIKQFGQFVIRLTLGNDVLERMEEALININGQFDAATAKAAQLAETLKKDALRATRELELEETLTLGVTPSERVSDINARLDKQIKDIGDKYKEQGQKVLEAFSEAGGTPGALEAKNNAFEQIRVARNAEEAAARAQASRSKALIISRESLRVNKAITSEDIKQSNLANKLVGLSFGRVGAIEDELSNLRLMTDLKIRQVQLSENDQNVQNAKINNLKLEEQVRRNQLEIELEKLKVQKQVIALQRSQNLANLQRGLEQEAAGFALPTGNIFADPFSALERQQGFRRENVLSPLRNQIEELDLQYAGAANLEERAKIFGQIEDLEKQIEVYDRLLPKIEEAQRVQLAYNEALSLVSGPVDQLVNGFTEIIAGTKSVEQAFADLLRSLADTLIKYATQMIAQYVAIGIARTFAGVPPADGGTAFPTDSPVGVASPAGFNLGGFGAFQKRAKGGPVGAGSPYMVGERGPELFVPRSSGTIIPNNALGGGANVTVNVDASGSNVQGDSNQASQLGKAIGAAVQAELVKQKRPGGLLAGV